jgi:hypothetical protein
MQSAHTTLELRDQVFLITPLPGLLHDLGTRHLPIVGDVEEVADVIEQGRLASLDR